MDKNFEEITINFAQNIANELDNFNIKNLSDEQLNKLFDLVVGELSNRKFINANVVQVPPIKVSD